MGVPWGFLLMTVVQYTPKTLCYLLTPPMVDPGFEASGEGDGPQASKDSPAGRGSIFDRTL